MTYFERIKGTRGSRLAALGLFFTLLALAALELGLWWADGLARLRAEREQAEALAARLLPTATNDARSPQEVDAGLERIMIAAATPGQAAADLQDHVKSLLNDAGAVLERLTPLGADTDKSLPTLGLTAHFKTDTDGLQRILHGLETGAPRLIIADLDVEARARDPMRPLTVRIGLRAPVRIADAAPRTAPRGAL